MFYVLVKMSDINNGMDGFVATCCEVIDDELPTNNQDTYIVPDAETKPGDMKLTDAEQTKTSTQELLHEGGSAHVRNICDTNLSVSSTHIANVHQRSKTHVCESCDASFGQKGHLTRHISTVHQGVKSHRCEICDKSFSARSSLSSATCNKIFEQSNLRAKQALNSRSECGKAFAESFFTVFKYN